MMMIKKINIKAAARVIWLATGAALISMSAYAEVVDSEGGTGFTSKPGSNSYFNPRNSNNRKSVESGEPDRQRVNELRCWQNGKLIIDEEMLEMVSIPDSSDKVVFTNNSNNLHIFSMRDSFCMYNQGGRK